MADALLIYGDSERSATLRHEVRIPIIDPFLFGLIDDTPHVMVSTIERERVEAALPGAELHDLNDLGIKELRESGLNPHEMWVELTSRAAAAMGVREAKVDPDFPLLIADRLRRDGIELSPDPELFAQRRRAKLDWELEGIRRAQEAAQAGVARAAELLRGADVDGDRLVVGGAPLTADSVRAELQRVCAELDCPSVGMIVASYWQGFGHEPGSGPLPAHLPIQVDIWPRDEESGCWADMTRTFVVGEITEPVREQEALVRDALEQVRAATRPGVTGRELHAITCEVFEAAGHRTQRTGPGDDPTEGFQFSLGHGVGLEVHEEPSLSQVGREPLVAGDVLAIEPGLWVRELGGVRFEDLLLVTDEGCETLTDYPYDLAP